MRVLGSQVFLARAVVYATLTYPLLSDRAQEEVFQSMVRAGLLRVLMLWVLQTWDQQVLIPWSLQAWGC